MDKSTALPYTLDHGRKYYPALDGIRGLAIILVILYHNFQFTDKFFFGWLGVDLFFVLSGYLITDILLRTVNSPHYLRNFFGRRMLRIFPLYYGVLIIFLVIFPLLNLYREQLQYFITNQWWFWLYLQNWLLSFHFPANGNYLNHLWSLAVEEQFYLVWPFLVLLFKKPKTLLWVMLILLIALMTLRSVIWFQKIEDLNYTTLYTFTRVDGIFIGCIIALLQHIDFYFLKKKMTLIIILMAVINFLFYFLNQPYGFLPYLALVGYTTFAVLFGFLIYECVAGNNRVIQSFFSISPLRFLGKISYGFYIFHWPVYQILNPLLEERFQTSAGLSPFLAKTVSALTALAVTLLLSVASYYFYETPFLKLKKYFVK